MAAKKQKRVASTSRATRDAAEALFDQAYGDFLERRTAKSRKVAEAAYDAAIAAGVTQRALWEWAGELMDRHEMEMIESVGMWFEKNPRTKPVRRKAGFEKNPGKSKYGWVIVRDFIYNGKAVGVMGPRDVSFTEKEIRSKGELARMLDDDGELYFHVKIMGDYDGFEPLDDFGTPNAGCTEIEYKNPKTGEWERL